MPVISELAEEHKEDYVIAKINVDKNPELAQKHGVRSIPALFFLENKEVTEKLVGLHSKSVLNSKIKQHLNAVV